jgi:hypothetical protein
MRSQGLKPDARCFYNIHELSYQMKATGKEQYHNNFSCYSFMPRSGASYPVPAFRKKWLGSWMQEWFYVKNDLDQREDIRGIIQCLIWSRFGIRRPSVALGNDVQACQTAFNTICTYISMRDLIQEHIAYRVWPLASGWEMPKEAAAGSSQSGLIYLKYAFWFKDRFDEPNDDWLDAIEATSDELLGAYSRAEDEAMTVAFGARGKKRLNRVFYVIGFIYPNYCFPARKQKGKRKIAASASSSASKAKKVKVLTHRPRRTETVNVPELIERAGVAPATKLGHDVLVKASTNSAKEPKLQKTADRLKVLSPPGAIGLPKPSSIPAVTPRKRRIVSMLDAVLESVKTSDPASAKAHSAQTKDARKIVVANVANAPAEVGPSEALPKLDLQKLHR